MMVNHDARPGHLDRCQVCGSDELRLLIDLGHQPLCDALLTKADLNEWEMYYPLRLMQCEQCSLAQLDYVVPAGEVYPASYPYRAGISWPIVAAHEEMAKNLISRFGPGLCVDIGSNDGTLLSRLQRLGCEVVGVEPTDVAEIAREAGVATVKDFFSETLAYGLADNHGRARIITMTNVFAHMADLGEVMRGVCALLAEDGVLVIENHYLLDILERNQFDSIYHEHVRTYTLRSLMALFRQYGMEVFDVERVPRYGGNIRAYVARRGQRSPSPSVSALLRKEESSGLYGGFVWARFRERVADGRDRFMDMLVGREVAGCSAPGRASTLLNFYGVRPDVMPWTGELDGSLKIGKYLPGCHIPVVSNLRIRQEQPEYLVLLAWHYADQIEERLRAEGVTSTLVVPLPNATLRVNGAQVAA